MLTNKTNNLRILKMFRKAKRLINSGDSREAIQLLVEAVQEIKQADIYFELENTESHFHHQRIDAESSRNYARLFCLIHDLKINIQDGQNREALIKINKIIITDMFADYVIGMIKRSEKKADKKPRGRNTISFTEGTTKLYVKHAKGWKVKHGNC